MRQVRRNPRVRSPSCFPGPTPLCPDRQEGYPGVYNIHSPRVPTREDVELLAWQALLVLPPEQLWVNPDVAG